MSLETILPFLQPIAHLITDPDFSEVMVNGSAAVFTQRGGTLQPVNARVEQRYLLTAVKRIARSLGEDISESKPLLDARLPDGSRVAAAFPPCSICGVTLTIRKFQPHWSRWMNWYRAGRFLVLSPTRSPKRYLTANDSHQRRDGYRQNDLGESPARLHPATGAPGRH